MPSGSEFSIVLADPHAPDPLTLAKALAAVRKTPVQDQMVAAKSAWGILAESLDASAAEALSTALTGAGVRTRMIPATELAALPEAAPLAKPEPGWEQNLALVAAAAIKVTTTTTQKVKEGPNAAQKVLNTAILLGTGLPIKIGGRERTVEKTRETSDILFYADLYYENPSHRRRIEAAHFDYSFLKERKLYQVLGNFKLMLGELAAAAAGAWKNHGTRILLENKPIQQMGYETLKDLERESRWLMTLRRAGGSQTT